MMVEQYEIIPMRTPTRALGSEVTHAHVRGMTSLIVWNVLTPHLRGQDCFSNSMSCTDGLSLHLVGKRHLLVCLGVSLGNGELGGCIWESHNK